MQIHKMHIMLEEGLQKLSSNINRYVTPEQKDLHLNTQINLFVDSQFEAYKKKSFEDFQRTQYMMDTLGSLYVRAASLPAYIDKGSPFKSVFCHIPGDYKHLVKDSSLLTVACGEEKRRIVSKMHVCAFSIEATDNVDYKTFEIYSNDNKIFDIRDYPEFQGLSDRTERFLLYPLVEQGIEGVYYERFGKVYKPREFLLVSSSSVTIRVTFGSEEKEFTSQETILERYATTSERKVAPNRLYRGEHIDLALYSPYEGTNYDSPLSQLVGRILYVYENPKFSVEEVLVDYIRKPATVSSLFGVDCDLPEESQLTVVDRTVEYIAALLGDQRYATLKEQNNKFNN
jgi:hypothetical protein